jgi:hypothetical protein
MRKMLILKSELKIVKQMTDIETDTDVFSILHFEYTLKLCFNHNVFSYLLQFVRTITFFNLQKVQSFSFIFSKVHIFHTEYITLINQTTLNFL